MDTIDTCALSIRSEIQRQLPQNERTAVQLFVDREHKIFRYNIPSGQKINKKNLPNLDGWTIKTL